MGVPQNLWLMVENPIKMHDLEVPPFQETSIYNVVIFSMGDPKKNTTDRFQYH